MPRKQLILDRYEVIGEAGTGGYATVLHAFDPDLSRNVAIKCIKLSQSEAARARLLAMEKRMQREEAALREAEARCEDAALEELDEDDLFRHIPGLEEAQMAAKLNDANIVTVYDCKVHENMVYIIMEYVEGKTLASIMDELGDNITDDIIAAVFSSVAHALETAHESNILHLDIKPKNVIINKKGVVKVTDFGLSTLMDSGGFGSTGGGTIGYMPLEQMREEALDVRTDEWALASLTYEMLSGENPFRADTLTEAQRCIEEADLVVPSMLWNSFTTQGDDVVFAALDPNPDERYDSVADFAEDLMPFLGNANAGKKALAAIVNGEEPREAPQPENPPAKRLPLVDRLGPFGSKVITRLVASAAALVVAAVALVNMRPDPTAVYGIATEAPLVFWVVALGVTFLTALLPAWGAGVAFALFAVMLICNQAYMTGLALIVVTAAWFWRARRMPEGAPLAALLQPLLGMCGMAAISPVVAGALLDVRDAAATAAFAVVTSIAFASLGSSDLLGWNASAYALTPADAAVAGTHITDTLVRTMASPMTWCVLASWMLAALAYALFCERGTRAFDIAGACVCACVLIAGVVGGTIAQAALAQSSMGASAAISLAWLPQPATLAGAVIPGALGIILALMNVPDRVRLEEGEW